MSEDNSEENDEFDEIIETARDYYWDDETQSTVASNQTRNEHQNLHHQPDTIMEEEQELTNRQEYDPLELLNAD